VGEQRELVYLFFRVATFIGQFNRRHILNHVVHPSGHGALPGSASLLGVSRWDWFYLGEGEQVTVAVNSLIEG
jgi:hypothetical protein